MKRKRRHKNKYDLKGIFLLGVFILAWIIGQTHFYLETHLDHNSYCADNTGDSHFHSNHKHSDDCTFCKYQYIKESIPVQIFLKEWKFSDKLPEYARYSYSIPKVVVLHSGQRGPPFC